MTSEYNKAEPRYRLGGIAAHLGRALGVGPLTISPRVLPTAVGLCVILAPTLAAVRAEYLASSVLLLVLLAFLAAHDFWTLRLPNVLTFVLAFGGVCARLLHEPATIAQYALGALVVAGSLFLVGAIYERRRGVSGLGFGDVKLIGASCLWIAADEMLSALVIACITALLFAVVRFGRDASKQLSPFGSFICLGVWITWVVGPWQNWVL